MFQIIVTIVVLMVVLGGLLAISLSRGEGKELQKSCGCAVQTPGEPKDDSCGCTIA